MIIYTVMKDGKCNDCGADFDTVKSFTTYEEALNYILTIYEPKQGYTWEYEYEIREHELIGTGFTVECNADGIDSRISVTDSNGGQVLRLRNASDDAIQLAKVMNGVEL